MKICIHTNLNINNAVYSVIPDNVGPLGGVYMYAYYILYIIYI